MIIDRNLFEKNKMKNNIGAMMLIFTCFAFVQNSEATENKIPMPKIDFVDAIQGVKDGVSMSEAIKQGKVDQAVVDGAKLVNDVLGTFGEDDKKLNITVVQQGVDDTKDLIENIKEKDVVGAATEGAELVNDVLKVIGKGETQLDVEDIKEDAEHVSELAEAIKNKDAAAGVQAGLELAVDLIQQAPEIQAFCLSLFSCCCSKAKKKQ